MIAVTPSERLLEIAERAKKRAADLEADTLVSIAEGSCNHRIAQELRDVVSQIKALAKEAEGWVPF